MGDFKTFAVELLEKYPDLPKMDPPFNLNLCGKSIAVGDYITAADSIKKLKREHLCKKLDAFTVKFDDNTYGAFIKDGLSDQRRLGLILHEIGHVVNGYFEAHKEDETAEAEANGFVTYCLYLLQEKDSSNKTSKYSYIYVIIVLTIIMAIAFFYNNNKSSPPTTASTSQKELLIEEEKQEQEITVLAVSYNHKYHRKGCKWIKGREGLIEMYILDAVSKMGLENACKDCVPLLN